MTARLVAALCTAVFLVGPSRPAEAEGPPMIFVHGFHSNESTWTAAAVRLQNQLVITSVMPTLSWRETFGTQASELTWKVGGVPGIPFAVAHSNGGPVIREWSKTKQLSGLLTLSSPNQGAPIANNAGAFANYNASIATGIAKVHASFTDPTDPSIWIYYVLQGALNYGSQTLLNTAIALGSAGFDLAAPVYGQDRVDSTFMRQLNSPANLAREAASIPNRAAIVTSVSDFHLGGIFRALYPSQANGWRIGLYAAVGTLDAWAANLASSGTPRDIQRAQAVLTASFLLSLHELMWCQAISDPTPYAVSLGGTCYANDSFLPTWSHVLPGALAIPKPNMPEHILQTQAMTPVLYEVLTNYMGVPPRGNSPAGSRMDGGQQLRAGQELWSPDGRYRLIYQSDGNLVIYHKDGTPVWWTGTNGTTPGTAVMQTDGNFVVYDAAGAPKWHTYTFGNAGAYLSMQNNASAVVYRSDGVRLWGSPVPPWEVNTPPSPNPAPAPAPTPAADTLTAGGRIYPGQAVTSLDGRFALTYQTDGNLVLYGPGGVPRWSTQTFSIPGYTEMQNDGNFVVYVSSGIPLWASNSSGSLNSRLVVQNDGNVVIFTSRNVVAWSSGTGGS
jgi:hypothetical protein